MHIKDEFSFKYISHTHTMTRTVPGHVHIPWTTSLESGGAVGNKGRLGLGDTVGKRELEVGHHQLLDVRTANVFRLFNLDNTENIHIKNSSTIRTRKG